MDFQNIRLGIFQEVNLDENGYRFPEQNVGDDFLALLLLDELHKHGTHDKVQEYSGEESETSKCSSYFVIF